jgi:hypothetical protein
MRGGLNEKERGGEMFGYTIIKTKRIEAVRNQVKVAISPGTYDYSPYYHGMANGVLCALATLEGKGPEYMTAPKKWGDGHHSHRNPRKKKETVKV